MDNDTRDAKIEQLCIDMATIKQAICGNGTKGLNDRVGECETEIETIKNSKRKSTPFEIFTKYGAIALVCLAILGAALVEINKSNEVAQVKQLLEQHMNPK